MIHVRFPHAVTDLQRRNNLIYHDYFYSTDTIRQIASRYGITPQRINSIVFKTWERAAMPQHECTRPSLAWRKAVAKTHLCSLCDKEFANA